MKETLRKGIASRIASPLTAIGFGIATILGAAPYAITAESSANKKVEETFPHIASTEALKQARQTVLIFDSIVHNAISRGEPVVYDTKTADITKLRQAIRLIDDEQTTRQQRHELRQNLQKPINKRADNIVYAGMLLAIAGTGGMVLRAILREKQNKKMSSEQSNT